MLHSSSLLSKVHVCLFPRKSQESTGDKGSWVHKHYWWNHETIPTLWSWGHWWLIVIRALLRQWFQVKGCSLWARQWSIYKTVHITTSKVRLPSQGNNKCTYITYRNTLLHLVLWLQNGHTIVVHTQKSKISAIISHIYISHIVCDISHI